MKLMVNHCEFQGIIEAVWSSLPLVCMPIIYDQEDTMVKIVQKGIGLGSNKDTVTSEAVYDAIQEALRNPKYRKNTHKITMQMRDVEEKPLDRTIKFLE